MLRLRKAAMYGAAVCCSVLFAGTALAHGVNISGVSVCENGESLIEFTASSAYPGPLVGEHPKILVYVNGFEVASGAFSDPVYTLSGTTLAPEGDSAALAAYASPDFTWGDGWEAGQTAHTTVVIDRDCPSVLGEGRFTGGGHQIRLDNLRVTRGLTLHCDLLLSNNLEINWVGNQFHMDEHLTTVACSDDPLINQAPPAAPLDTMIGIGSGRYNGEDGYTVEFTLVDQGEPGAGVDQAAFLIYETADPTNVVLEVPLQVLSGGNLQAHFDQPHK